MKLIILIIQLFGTEFFSNEVIERFFQISKHQNRNNIKKNEYNQFIMCDIICHKNRNEAFVNKIEDVRTFS